jgi:hypothetical protein
MAAVHRHHKVGQVHHFNMAQVRMFVVEVVVEMHLVMLLG